MLSWSPLPPYLVVVVVVPQSGSASPPCSVPAGLSSWSPLHHARHPSLCALWLGAGPVLWKSAQFLGASPAWRPVTMKHQSGQSCLAVPQHISDQSYQPIPPTKCSRNQIFLYFRLRSCLRSGCWHKVITGRLEVF